MRDDVRITCGVCAADASLWGEIEEHVFTDCPHCDSIALDSEGLALIDSGNPLRRYNEDYWKNEANASRERAWGVSLERTAEAILYCQRRIERFLDVGAGNGDLLHSLNAYLPSAKSKFFGIESFPPIEHSAHPNYFRGQILDLAEKFDAGICMEVIEHLTPAMLCKLAEDLAQRSNSQAL